jgi:hypothetical protein
MGGVASVEGWRGRWRSIAEVAGVRPFRHPCLSRIGFAAVAPSNSFALIGAGESNGEIAGKLFGSVNTVKTG